MMPTAERVKQASKMNSWKDAQGTMGWNKYGGYPYYDHYQGTKGIEMWTTSTQNVVYLKTEFKNDYLLPLYSLT